MYEPHVHLRKTINKLRIILGRRVEKERVFGLPI